MTIMPVTPDTDDPPPVGPPAIVDLGPLPGLLGTALRRAQLAVSQDLHRNFAAEDIRPGQYAALVLLKHNPGVRATQAAAALGVKRTNFVPLLDAMAARGLAERRRVTGDRRASALFLTATGADVLARLEKIVAAHEKKFAARLGVEGRLQLMGLLHRLSEAGFDPG